ncbi:MAG: right-handed parallel beta-helix repeat-containing protein, partial [Deltaproteobacteria bacterium]|nr:right-handed parallel beta-helix repeat-containing protein [Deltaproteobacteria bacterium]
WGTLTDDPEVVAFVSPDASSNGDGTIENPFRLEDALADLAGVTGVIAVAAGDYEARLVFSEEQGGLTVAGSCFGPATVTGPDDAPTLEVRGGEPEISDLTLTGGRPGVSITGGRPTLDDLIIDGANEYGIRATAARGTLRRVTVQSTRPVDDFSGGAEFGNGAGLIAEFGADLLLEDVTFSETTGKGVEAFGPGSRLDITGLVIRDVRRSLSTDSGYGLAARYGAEIVGSDWTLEGIPGFGIRAREAGTSITASDVSITGGTGAGFGTGGISTDSGAALALERVVIDNQSCAGLTHGDGTLTATELTISNVVEDAACLGTWGRGVELRDGSSAVLEELVVRDVGTRGVVVFDAESVHLVRPTVERTGAEGLWVSSEEALTVEVTGGLFDQNGRGGAIVYGPGAALRVLDTTISRAPLDPEEFSGFGIVATDEARLEVTNVDLVDNQRSGIDVYSGALAVLDDVRIQAPDQVDSPFGARGIGVLSAELEFDGVSITNSKNMGLGVWNGDSRVSGEDLTVNGVRPLGDGSAGAGAVFGLNASVDLRDSLITGAANTGIIVGGLGSGDGKTTLTRVTVENTGSTGVNPGRGAAVSVNNVGLVDLIDCTLRNNGGPGISALERTVVNVVDTEIAGNTFSGVAGIGASVSVSGGRIAETRSDPGLGGGLGIWLRAPQEFDSLEIPTLDASGVLFEGLPGPAAHLWGAGIYDIADSEILDGGTSVLFNGGVLARGLGGSAFTDHGLRITDTSFTSLEGDGVLLIGSGAELSNLTFPGTSGEPVYVQQCVPDQEPVTISGFTADSSCQSSARPLGPAVDYQLELEEVGVIGEPPPPNEF